MKHASEMDLALYAGGDLGFLASRRVAWHLGRCAECRARHDEFAAVRDAVRDQASLLPRDLDWETLSAEMTANINLGLSAGECVAQARQPQPLTGWRPAAVFASALAVVGVAWFVNQPAKTPRMAEAVPAEASVEATHEGIELNDRGRVLTLQHAGQSNVTFSVNLQGAARARYVDSETGQVTINNVYVQ